MNLQRNKEKDGSASADMGELSRIYYDNWDLELLLNLLATGSGVAPALAIIALFDQVSGLDI